MASIKNQGRGVQPEHGPDILNALRESLIQDSRIREVERETDRVHQLYRSNRDANYSLPTQNSSSNNQDETGRAAFHNAPSISELEPLVDQAPDQGSSQSEPL